MERFKMRLEHQSHFLRINEGVVSARSNDIYPGLGL